MLKVNKSEEGFSLIEVLIALALLGIIAASFLLAVSTATKAAFIADERTTAESLARSQLEYVKEQEYMAAGVGGVATYIEIDLTGYPGYTIESYDRSSPPTVEDIVAIPWDAGGGQAVNEDTGLQKITVVIMHYEKEIIILEGYKVDDSVY